MPKRFLFDAKARSALRRGLDALGDALRVTLGPRGRSVILDRAGGSPAITSDGVAIASRIELPDPFENLGARLGKEVTTKTQESAGDGTTTAVLLTQAIVRAGLRVVEAGANAMAVRRGLEKSSARVAAQIAEQARPVRGVRELSRVASLAAGNDPLLGRLIGEALYRVGPGGAIRVETGRETETRVKTVPGYRFEEGYLSPYFVTDPERMEADLENCRVFLLDGRLEELGEVVPLLQRAADENYALLVVAGDMGEEVLATLVVNRLRGTLNAVAVKAPGFGEERRKALDEIAAATGAVVIAPDRGLPLGNARWEHLGKTERVVVEADATTLIGGEGISNAAKGIEVIRVGAATQTEIEEARTRAEDALAASRAVMAEGIVPGGGSALLWAARSLDGLLLAGDEELGARVLRLALSAPVRQISQNAGWDGSEVVARVRASGCPSVGFNADTLRVEDLAKARVMDPAQVVRAGLRNAVSIAGLILTTESLVAEVEEGKGETGTGRKEGA